jgi:hypothetical protein
MGRLLATAAPAQPAVSGADGTVYAQIQIRVQRVTAYWCFRQKVEQR